MMVVKICTEYMSKFLFKSVTNEKQVNVTTDSNKDLIWIDFCSLPGKEPLQGHKHLLDHWKSKSVSKKSISALVTMP